MRKDKVKYLDELFQELITSSDKTIWEYIREIKYSRLKEVLVRMEYLTTLLKRKLDKDITKWDEPEKREILPIPIIRNEIADKDLKTVQEIHEYLNLSEVTIRKHIRQGKIKAIKVGNKYRIPLSQFK